MIWVKVFISVLICFAIPVLVYLLSYVQMCAWLGALRGYEERMGIENEGGNSGKEEE